MMRRSWIAGGVAAAVLLTGAFWLRGQGTDAAGGEAKEKRTINTSGSATVRVKPDSARVFFGIETMAKGIKEARGENNKRVKGVIEALNALKIPKMRMKTSDVSVSLEKSSRREDQLPEILGYKVTHTFTVVVPNDDQEKLGQLARLVLDTALEHGANIVERISFFKLDDAEARREALTKAVEAALVNAHAMAGGAKVKVREPISLHGQPDYSWGSRNDYSNTQQIALPAGGGGDAPMVAGDLLITCTVNVSCTY